MKVYVYPADEHGCGHHRLIWPAVELQKLGHDVTVVMPGDRAVRLELDGDRVVRINLPADAEVVVLQRLTNRYMAAAVELIRSQGVAVVVDIDDDLRSIHPANPAFAALHPRNEGTVGGNGMISHHSWAHLDVACRAATLVTVSTPALLPRYAAHGRGRVIYNYLAPHYYGVPRVDSDVVGWPASLHSHPNDPADVGNAVARFVNELGGQFEVTCRPDGVGRAFGLNADPPGVEALTGIYEWPRVVAGLGVGIAPLADTRFNAAKSWLKPLEMCAVGVPWIGSPRAEYVRLHEYGGDILAGLIADHPRRWYRMLRDLAASAEMREEIRQRGYHVADRLRLADHAWRHWEAWSDALAAQRGSRVAAAG